MKEKFIIQKFIVMCERTKDWRFIVQYCNCNKIFPLLGLKLNRSNEPKVTFSFCFDFMEFIDDKYSFGRVSLLRSSIIDI